MTDFWVWCGITAPSAQADTGMLLAKVRQIAAPGDRVTAVAVCPRQPPLDGVLRGADRVLWAACDASNGIKAVVLKQMIRQYTPDIVLFAADLEGSQVAAQAAAGLESGLSADCTDLRMENGRLVMHRPAFGGSVEADILCCGTGLQMATVRPGIFSLSQAFSGRPVLVPFSADALPADSVQIISRTIAPGGKEMRSADILVAGGLGVGSKEGFALLGALADALGGQLAASRAAVDAGYVDWKRQVGQTGAVVHPALYLAFGISGAVQHIAGMRSAGCVIAVNTDPRAPIFDYSDLAITADWKKTAELLLAEFQDVRH